MSPYVYRNFSLPFALGPWILVSTISSHVLFVTASPRLSVLTHSLRSFSCASSLSTWGSSKSLRDALTSGNQPRTVLFFRILPDLDCAAGIRMIMSSSLLPSPSTKSQDGTSPPSLLVLPLVLHRCHRAVFLSLSFASLQETQEGTCMFWLCILLGLE